METRSQERKIKWGIMSTGKIAHTFAKTVQYVETAELYAVSSRKQETADAFARQYGFEKSYGSAAEMLADPQVEVVYVCSPMSCHYQDAKACLEAGKAVLCEKTVTLNGAQLQELLDLAREKGLFFMEAMWMKCIPFFRTAKKWIAEGRIGEPRMVKADFQCLNEVNVEDRLFAKKLGGGALLDLGVYPLSFAMSVLGNQPAKVIAQAHMRYDVDFDTTVLLQYENGAMATLFASFDYTGNNGAVIVGEKGSIVVEHWFFCSQNVKLYDACNRLVEDVSLPHRCTGYEYEVEEVHRCLWEGKQESELIPWSDTQSVMAVLDAVRAQIGFRYDEE